MKKLKLLQFLFSFLLIIISSLEYAQSSSRSLGWNSMANPTGVKGVVSSTVIDKNGDLYICGSFTYAGGVLVNKIAKWDGNNWTSIGSGIPGTGIVNCLAFDTSGNIYAGGSFTITGGGPANRIAKWDGTSWTGLGIGTMTGAINTIAIDENNILYVGGTFPSIGGTTTPGIAKWDGSTWSDIGSGLSQVFALAIDNTNNDLYAGGVFSGNVAKWNGSSWVTLGTGTNSKVVSLVFDNSNQLYAGGSFTSAGGDTLAKRIAKWDGATWSSVGGGATDIVSAVTIDAGNNIYIAQKDVSNYKIKKWDGIVWTDIGVCSFSSVNTMVTKGYNLFAGGFNYVDGKYVAGIAHWDGVNWFGFGNGFNNFVVVVAEDGLGNVYAGGRFTIIGELSPVEGVAKWNGYSWSLISPVGGITGEIEAIAFDKFGNMYVGGGFGMSTIPTSYIAKFDGTTWSALGGIGMNDNVFALVTDTLGNVYAGGDFWTASGVSVSYIAKWDGTVWSNMNFGLGGSVRGLAIDKNQNIYATGQFSSTGMGMTVNNIAKWDGTSWSALGSGLNNFGRAVAVDDSNNVYVGGVFSTAGGIPANRVAKWNGTTWSSMGSIPTATGGSEVWSLAVDNAGNVYAGGEGISTTGSPNGGMIKWNGAWTDMASLAGGYTDVVYSISAKTDCRIYAGGDFMNIGGIASSDVAWYGIGTTPSVTLDLSAIDTLCTNSSVVTLSGESPSGGIFYGDGIVGNTFDPLLAGAGTHVITYVYDDVSGCSSYAAELIYVSLCTDVTETTTVSDRMNLFPNPATTEINISIEGDDIKNYEISVFNILGEKQKLENTNSIIFVSELASGMYFINATNKRKDAHISRKFVKK